MAKKNQNTLVHSVLWTCSNLFTCSSEDGERLCWGSFLTWVVTKRSFRSKQEHHHFCNMCFNICLNTLKTQRAKDKTVTIFFLSRWSWVRGAMSCWRVQLRRMRREELLIRGNVWLWTGDVKILNRCPQAYICTCRNVSAGTQGVFGFIHSFIFQFSS